MKRASFLHHMEKLIENYLLVRNHFLDGDNLKCLYRLINSTDIQEPYGLFVYWTCKVATLSKLITKTPGKLPTKKLFTFDNFFPAAFDD